MVKRANSRQTGIEDAPKAKPVPRKDPGEDEKEACVREIWATNLGAGEQQAYLINQI